MSLSQTIVKGLYCLLSILRSKINPTEISKQSFSQLSNLKYVHNQQTFGAEAKTCLLIMYHGLCPTYLIIHSLCVQQPLIWTNSSDQETEIGGRVLIYKVKSLRSYNESGRNTKSISNSFIEVLVVRNGAQSLPHTLDLLRIQILN